ncbi:MAG: autotransporter outer membrane beta-barrel domain-containing protein [Deltaproteobacteria bacterium]|nr:autotransporter outer membrane beta-barrel domain-containing protein [Deltaproteobacteria bacterium]
MRPYGERHAPSGGEGGDRPWSLRASPWYSHIRHEAREGLIGYTVKALGLTLGVERSLFGGSALAGMTLSAAMPEVNGDGISLDTHIVSASSYATAILPFEIDLSAIVSYSLSRYDQDRVSEGSHYFAGYHGRGVSAAAMAGRRFQFARQFAARPYARMDYIHNDMEAYAEMGQGAQARTMSRNSTDLWQSELGADLIFSAENGLRLTGRLGWTRHFNNTTEFEGNYLPNQPSPSLFRVLSVQFDRTAFVYGLDVKFPVAESVDIGVSYDGSFSDHDSSHTGALTGNFSF